MDPVLQSLSLRDPVIGDKLDLLYAEQGRHPKVDELVEVICPSACYKERFPFYVAMRSLERRGLTDCLARAVLLEMYRITRLRGALPPDEFREIEAALFLSLLCKM